MENNEVWTKEDEQTMEVEVKKAENGALKACAIAAGGALLATIIYKKVIRPAWDKSVEKAAQRVYEKMTNNNAGQTYEAECEEVEG